MAPEFVAIYSVNIAIAIIGFISKRRAVQLAAAGVAFAAQLLYLFQELGVLGSW